MTPKKLLAAAKAHGMDPRQLAAAAGVAYTTLWSWTTGRGDIRLETYRALRRAALQEPAE